MKSPLLKLAALFYAVAGLAAVVAAALLKKRDADRA